MHLQMTLKTYQQVQNHSFLMYRGMYMDGYAKKSQQVGVGMAGCKQGILYEDYTSNVIPTAFLYMTPICGLCC